MRNRMVLLRGQNEVMAVRGTHLFKGYTENSFPDYCLLRFSGGLDIDLGDVVEWMAL